MPSYSYKSRNAACVGRQLAFMLSYRRVRVCCGAIDLRCPFLHVVDQLSGRRDRLSRNDGAFLCRCNHRVWLRPRVISWSLCQRFLSSVMFHVWNCTPSVCINEVCIMYAGIYAGFGSAFGLATTSCYACWSCGRRSSYPSGVLKGRLTYDIQCASTPGRPHLPSRPRLGQVAR